MTLRFSCGALSNQTEGEKLLEKHSIALAAASAAFGGLSIKKLDSFSWGAPCCTNSFIFKLSLRLRVLKCFVSGVCYRTPIFMAAEKIKRIHHSLFPHRPYAPNCLR